MIDTEYIIINDDDCDGRSNDGNNEGNHHGNNNKHFKDDSNYDNTKSNYDW